MSVNVHGMISLFPTNCLNNIHRKKSQVSTSVVYFWKLVINFSNSLIEHSVMWAPLDTHFCLVKVFDTSTSFTFRKLKHKLQRKRTGVSYHSIVYVVKVVLRVVSSFLSFEGNHRNADYIFITQLSHLWQKQLIVTMKKPRFIVSDFPKQVVVIISSVMVENMTFFTYRNTP